MSDQKVNINPPNSGMPSSIQKCFSVFMALYPILCMYKAFFKFTIGDIVLMLFFFASLFKPIKKDKRFLIVASFIVYALLTLFFNMLFSQVTASYVPSSLMFRLLKFIFYILCVFTCGKRYFDIKVFKKTMFIVAVTACFYIIYQYVMYYSAGKIVLGRIPGLNLYLDEYSTLDYSEIYDYSFRPSSLFLEPALFCHYTIVALILTLFTDKMPKGFIRVFIAILLTAGILMSTAAQGVLYLIIVYLIFGFKAIKNKGKALCFVIVAVIIALICYNKIEFVQYVVDRLLYNEGASEARLGSFKYALELEGIPSLFGYGYGVTPQNEYMTGATYVWYGCGIIGLLFSFGIFGSFYRNANNILARTICIIFFVMFFGTSLFYNYMLCWYFTIILCTSNLKGDLGNEHSIYSRSIQAKSIG